MSSKADKRRLEIVRIMQSEGEASVAQVAKEQGVTMETIRADFEYLASRHGWERTHGGIKMTELGKYNQHYFFHERQVVHMEEKKKLCLKVMDIISDGDCIYIDSGSTVIYLLNYLNLKRNLTIVTHSIGFLIRYTLDNFDTIFKEYGHRLIFIGGEVEANIMMTYGATFEQNVTEFSYDHIIFSVDAMDEKIGGTNVDYQAYAAIKSVFRQGKNKILLVDHSKFDLRATFKVITMEEISYLITDQPIKAPWESLLKQKKIHYFIA